MRTHTYLHSTKRNGPSIHWSSKPGSLLTFGGMGRLYLRQHRWQACPRATVHLQLPGSKLPYGGFDLDMKPWWNSICQYLPYTSHVKMCKTFQKIIENLLPAPQQNITKPGFHVLKSSPEEGVSLSPRLQVMHTQWSRHGKEARSGSEWALSLKRLAYGWYMLV